VAVISLAAIAAVAMADHATGYATAVSLFYLVPLYAVSWFSWELVAVGAGLLAGLSDSVMTFFMGGQLNGTTTLNSALQAAFFSVFVLVLAALKRAHRKLEMLSRTDPLTSLANGRHFAQIGEVEVERSARYKRPFSLVYMDADDFKSINDSLGHGAGDTFLRDIAARIRGTVRRTDTVARLGGDEFAILMPETDEPGARLAVGRIRKRLSGAGTVRGKAATFSYGIVTNPGYACTFEGLIKEADALMYEAKQGGKNAVRLHTLEGAL